MIKGITIELLTKTPNGVDEFNRIIYQESVEEVQNVLVAPTTSDDITSQLNTTGRKAVYTLAIPKGDTHDWENQRVRFFGKEWKAFGMITMGIEENVPTAWNKKIMVERYE